MTGLPSIYTPEQVVEQYPHLTARFLRIKARSGEFPHHRIDRQICFTEDDLRLILELSARPATGKSSAPAKRRSAPRAGSWLPDDVPLLQPREPKWRRKNRSA